MGLIFSSTQRFPFENGLVLFPLAKGWDLMILTNTGTPVFDFMKNSPQWGSYTYRLKPKSSYKTYTNQGYTNLKVRSSIELPANDPSWLSVASDWYPVANYTLANQSIYKDVSIIIGPPLTISQGIHNAKVKFHIEGQKNGLTEVLSSYEIPVVLNVFEEGLFYSPTDFTFYYNQSNYQIQTLKISGNNWRVNAPAGIRLDGPGTAQDLNGNYYATGTGMKTLDVTLDPSITFVLDDDPSVVIPITVEFAIGVYSIPVTVIQAGALYPEHVAFSIQSGVIDVPFHIIHLTRTDSFTVNLPPSLGYEILNTPAGNKLKIYTVDPSSYGSGLYWEWVNIVYHDASYNVYVTTSVGNQFDLGIDNSQAVFTHSMDDLEFNTVNTNTFIDLLMNVVGSENNINYQFPFFKGKAIKNVGSTLANFIKHDFSSGLEGNYPLSYFNLSVKEKNKQTTVLQYSKNNIPFLLGFKPEIKDNKAILQHNIKSRYSKRSIALVSVFALNGNFEYELLKNNVNVFTSPSTFGYLKTIKINFESYSATAGDVFDFVLKTTAGNISHQMIIFPDTFQSLDIVYLNSFGLQANFNFTGNTKEVLTELNNKTELFHNRSFLNTRKFLEKEVATINLNTGYVLQSQFIDVLELVKSPKAWVVLNNEKVLEIVPKNQEVAEFSSDNFLNSYNIEFEINKEKYAQDYNF